MSKGGAIQMMVFNAHGTLMDRTLKVVKTDLPAFHHQRNILSVTRQAIDPLKRIAADEKKVREGTHLDASQHALHAKDFGGSGGRALKDFLSAEHLAPDDEFVALQPV